MDTRQELLEARETIAEGLDDKFKNVPEWRAIRAIDRALAALDRPSAVPAHAGSLVRFPDGGTKRLYPTYTVLARRFIEHKNAPVTTPELVEYIKQSRPLHSDLEKAKINITSSLSKDEKFESIPWEGGRAWWLKGRDLPSRAASLLSKLGSNLGEESP